MRRADSWSASWSASSHSRCAAACSGSGARGGVSEGAHSTRPRDRAYPCAMHSRTRAVRLALVVLVLALAAAAAGCGGEAGGRPDAGRSDASLDARADAGASGTIVVLAPGTPA